MIYRDKGTRIRVKYTVIHFQQEFKLVKYIEVFCHTGTKTSDSMTCTNIS